MDDLLGGDGRIFEDQVKVLPAGMSLQKLLGKAGAGEIGEKQLVTDEGRSLGEFRVFVHLADGARTDEKGDIGQVSDADFLVFHGVVHHGGESRAFADRLARELGVIVGPGGFDPRINVERLIL